MPTQVASLYAAIGADLTGLNNGLKSAQNILHNAGAGLAKSGAVMSATITAPLVMAGKQMISTAADFESQMNIMALAAARSGTPLETLKEAAIAVGGDTRLLGIDALQAADAMTNFYKAGLDTAQIMGNLDAYMKDGAELGGALRAAIDMAAASELNLARASDVVAVAMATFGLDASEASRITDGFVQAADASLASVGDLADALTNVGPSAAAFGLSLEDTNTALAILSNQGILGAEAGTNLKSMLNNMIRPTDKVQKALEELNVQLYDQAGNMRELPDVIEQLDRATSKLTQQQRLEYVQTIAGTYGQKAMLALLKDGAAGWQKMSGMIGSAATTQESAAARTKGLNAALERLGSSLQTLQIKVGEPLIKNFVTPFVDKLVAIADKVLDLDPQILNLGVAIAAAAAAAGPILMVLGGIATGLGALLSPVGLAVAAVAGLGAAFVASQGGIEGAIAAVQNWYNALDNKSIAGIGKALLDGLVATAKEIPSRLLGWTENLLAWAKSKDTAAKVSDAGMVVGRALGNGLRDWLLGDEQKDRAKTNLIDMITSAIARAWAAAQALAADFGRGLGEGIHIGLAQFNILDWLGEQIRNEVGKMGGWWEWLKAQVKWETPTAKSGGVLGGLLTAPQYGPAVPPGYASGTSYASGGWSLVGERGPELVNLPRGSQVMPADKTREALRGNVVNVHPGAIVINVANGNAGEIQRGVVGALRQIGVPA